MNETQQKIYTQAKGKWDAIAKPIDSLGVFEDMVARLCAIAGTMNPGDYKRRALLTLCADHGVVAEGVTQTTQAVTAAVTRSGEYCTRLFRCQLYGADGRRGCVCRRYRYAGRSISGCDIRYGTYDKPEGTGWNRESCEGTCDVDGNLRPRN